jgi:hypothetical protein
MLVRVLCDGCYLQDNGKLGYNFIGASKEDGIEFALDNVKENGYDVGGVYEFDIERVEKSYTYECWEVVD